MKLVLNCHKPFTCEFQHDIYILNKKETAEFTAKYGSPQRIIRDYRQCKPNPDRITGMGWVIKNGGYSKESVYITKSTFRREQL